MFTQTLNTFHILVYHLLALCLVVLDSSDTLAQSPLNEKSGKRLIKQLEQERSRLQGALQSLLALQKLNPNRRAKDDTQKLRQVEKLVDSIHQKVMKYFQTQRIVNFPTQLKVQLRDQVWRLLDYRNNLFKRVKGHFCLRPEWEELMAKIYLVHQQKSQAISHYLRAYHCGGHHKNLEAAKQIKHSIAQKPSK